MKQNLRILMVFLMVLLFGGGELWANNGNI